MRRLAAVAVAVALAVPAGAAAPTIPFVAASASNYAHAHRRASAVRLLVIHATEASYGGTIAWFANPRARASANYVVGRDGAVTQMVPWWHIAWHAGNGWVNAHSLGIEHEGYTNTPWTFTDAEYRTSAQLVAQLARRYRIPLDRRHVIGHNEVPDPFHPGLYGGWAHHTDPGRYWDWTRFMTYARTYASGAVPPPPAYDVTVPALRFGATVGGALHWEAATTGAVTDHVEFLVDGKTVVTSRAAPYADDVETSTLTNGRHALGVHAVATDGHVANATVVVKVQNAWPRFTSVTLTDQQDVIGAVPIVATTKGRVLRVEFLVDGALAATVAQPPYAWTWDTAKVDDGPHVVTVRAVGGRRNATRNYTVYVSH